MKMQSRGFSTTTDVVSAASALDEKCIPMISADVFSANLKQSFLSYFVAGENLAMQRENEKTAAVPVQQQANLGVSLVSKIYLLSICILIVHYQQR